MFSLKSRTVLARRRPMDHKPKKVCPLARAEISRCYAECAYLRRDRCAYSNDAAPDLKKEQEDIQATRRGISTTISR
jgi:hypothetical protein